MSLLQGIMGNATEAHIEELTKELAFVLLEHEKIETAYKILRDFFVFTDRRLILVDKQGLMGKKVEYLSIPYDEIGHFSIECAGPFDLESDLKIWIKGQASPLITKFNKDSHIESVNKTLAHYMLAPKL